MSFFGHSCTANCAKRVANADSGTLCHASDWQLQRTELICVVYGDCNEGMVQQHIVQLGFGAGTIPKIRYGIAAVADRFL